MFGEEITVISEQMKRILIELTFKEFNIQTVDIQNISISDNDIIYDILDEENTREILVFDFNNMFTIQVDGDYTETRTLIILDDNF